MAASYTPTYAPMEGCPARELYEKYKAGMADELRTNSAKEWFGTIVGYPLPRTRMALSWKLDTAATKAYKDGRYEDALENFCHWLACIDTDPSTGACSEMRATLTSNVAACLAALGLTDNAIEFYDRAVQEFKALPFSVLRDVSVSRLFYGKLVSKRVEFIENKIADLKVGKPPALDTYQDGFGVTRKWKSSEMGGGSAEFVWYDPTTWLASTSLYTRMGERPTAIGEEGAEKVPPNTEMI